MFYFGDTYKLYTLVQTHKILYIKGCILLYANYTPIYLNKYLIKYTPTHTHTHTQNLGSHSRKFQKTTSLSSWMYIHMYVSTYLHRKTYTWTHRDIHKAHVKLKTIL